mgnify:CR=1 FL=1
MFLDDNDGTEEVAAEGTADETPVTAEPAAEGAEEATAPEAV